MTDVAFSLENKLLIATPAMGDPRFQRSVILVCAHDEKGAMGIVVNRAKQTGLMLSDLLEQVGVEGKPRVADTPVLAGGPVDIDRGFVLHSADYKREDSTLAISDTLALTSTHDVLKALVTDEAPERAVLAIGYAGWGAGQLEAEMADSAWIVCEPDDQANLDSLVFGEELGSKWSGALSELGIDPAMLGRGGSA